MTPGRRRSPFLALVVLGLGGVAAGWLYRAKLKSWAVALASSVAPFVDSYFRPCSHFVAAWLLDKLGSVPEDLTDWEAWRAKGSELWDAVNVADWSRPWSGVQYVAELAGTSPTFAEAGAPVPELEVGRWNLVQLWWVKGERPVDPTRDTGHVKLVMALPDGAFRVLDSNLTRGYRDETVTTWSDGADLGVAPLPV